MSGTPLFIISPLKMHPLIKIVNSRLIDLPSPNSLFYTWNFGFLAIICLFIQICTGLFLSIHYCANIEIAFFRVVHIMQDVNYGWFFRFSHANGASLFFFLVYAHIGRGLYYFSWVNIITWRVGVIILFVLIATSFLGYVLPWGQISFWGATVITNLGSAIPYIGLRIVEWLWGGFSIRNAALTRFYSLHFILPFILIALVGVHLLFLHEETSRNPLGLSSKIEKIRFYPYYIFKDIFTLFIIIAFFFITVLEAPNIFGDCENFLKANPLVTPVHIQPEWYFLFAYAILRSIPNKLGGVIALVASVSILFILPFIGVIKFKGNTYYPINKFLFFSLISILIMLTWGGTCLIEIPYLLIGQLASIFYFLYFVFNSILAIIWDKFF